MEKISNLFQKYRAPAALMIIICVSLYANMSLLVSIIKMYPDIPKEDQVTIYEQRMKKIKDALPPSAVVGYVTTIENEKIFGNEKNFENVEFMAQYILAQYALAPIVIRNSTDYPLVIGNFVSGPPDTDLIKNKRLSIIKDFGDGLFLYKSERGK